MDKYIKAEDLIDRIYPVDPDNDGSDGCTVVYQNLTLSSPEIEAIVEEMPAADVVPVVRCRECIHFKPQNKSVRWNCTTLFCNRTATIKMDPDDFCSRGERSTDNSTQK